MPDVDRLVGPPYDLAAWSNPAARRVRSSAIGFLDRAIAASRARKNWDAGKLSPGFRASVGRRLVVQLRDEARLAAELFVAGAITDAQWRDRVAEIVGAGSLATTFALQGNTTLNRQDAEDLRAAIGEQMAFLARTAGRIESGDVPRDGRVVSWSLNYATSAWTAAQAAARAQAIRTGRGEERSVLGPAEHCRSTGGRSGCIEEAAKGWQPVGTLVPVGERACRFGCRCRWEFRGQASRRAKRVPSPPPIPPVPPEPKPLPPPEPASDPSWPPPAGSGADPAVLDARRRWAEARRAKRIADLNAADTDPEFVRMLARLAELRALPSFRRSAVELRDLERAVAPRRLAREQIADEVTRLNSWFDQVRDNPRLIPPGPIRDRIRLYMEGEGGEKLRAIRQAGDDPPELVRRRQELEADYADALARGKAGDLKALGRIPGIAQERDRVEKEIRQSIARRKERAHAAFAVDEPDRATLNIAPSADPIPLASGLAKLFRPGDRLDPATPGSPAAESADAGRRWLAEHLRAAGSGPVTSAVGAIPQGAEQRAYATNQGSTVGLTQFRDVRAAVHEFGHVLEYKLGTGFGDERVVARTLEFVAARTEGEVGQKLRDIFPDSGYGDLEYGREDDFARAFSGSYDPERARRRAFYAGKEYHDATEILPMGVEELYLHPVEFSRGDPEYAAFILGILDGSLR